VISHLGNKPRVLPIQCYAAAHPIATYVAPERTPAERRLMGVDVFVCADAKPDQLAERILAAANKCSQLNLQVITNRGVKVWPDGLPETYCTDHWRCRFVSDSTVSYEQVLDLLQSVNAICEVIKTENLYEFNRVPGYSAAQGM
jgi:isocitrate dehydrogenase